MKGRVLLFFWIWEGVWKWHTLAARCILKRNPNKKTSFRPETGGYHLSELLCLEILDRKRMIRKQWFLEGLITIRTSRRKITYICTYIRSMENQCLSHDLSSLSIYYMYQGCLIKHTHTHTTTTTTKNHQPNKKTTKPRPPSQSKNSNNLIKIKIIT